MKLRVNPLAVEDLKQIKAYVNTESQDPNLALKTVRSIMDHYSKLTEFPHMGASLAGLIGIKTDFRYLIWNNYVIFYRIDKEYASIYRILSSRQDYIRILFK